MSRAASGAIGEFAKQARGRTAIESESVSADFADDDRAIS
jgi:hypothetical protein